MKALVLIVALMMGITLIMTPVISDYFYQANIVRLMEKQGEGGGQVTLHSLMSENYRFGCWFTGSGMILVGLVGAFKLFATHGTNLSLPKTVITDGHGGVTINA